MLEAQDHLIGSLLQDRFLLEAQLGSGGMSTVYQAKDLLMERLVAVKVLQQNSENSAKRFERECRALAAVKCQQVPEIFSWGVTPEGLPYLVMELVEGTTLARKMEETPIAEASLCSIVVQVCDALTAIHAQGIVHRDLKPSNIMLVEAETELQAKVMDFGVVHLYEQQDALTGTADIIGSLHYLSPEHLTPRLLDYRSDLFSLGCIMYCMVSGHPPFQTDDAISSLRLLQTGERKAIPGRVPRYLATIINKCLAIDPNNRFQSADELKHAILERLEIADQSPTQRPAKSKETMYLALSALVLLLTLLATQREALVANWHGTNNAHSTFFPKDLNRFATKAKTERSFADTEKLVSERLTVVSNELHKGSIDRANMAFRQLNSELDRGDSPDIFKASALLNTVGLFKSVGSYYKDLIDDPASWVRLAHISKNKETKKCIFLALANTYSDAHRASQADNYFRQALKVPRDQSRAQILQDAGIHRDWALSLFFRKSDFDQQLNNISASTELLIGMTPPPAETIKLIREFALILNQIPSAERSEKKWVELSNLMLKTSKAVTDQNEKIECMTYAGALLATFRKAEASELLRSAITMSEKQQLWLMYQQAVNTLVDAQCEPSKLAKANLMQNVYSKLAAQKNTDSGNLMLASSKTGDAYAEMDNVDEAINYYQLALGHAKKCRNRSNENFGPSSKCPIMFEIAKFASVHGRADLARECMAEIDREDPSKLDTNFKDKLRVGLPAIQTRIRNGS